MKIYLDTVGCRLNQSEIEAYARRFVASGHILVSDPQNADLAVINTCTVTAQAASDSRQKIRQAQRLGARQVVVTGCWATMEAEEAMALAGVVSIIPNSAKDDLVAMLGLETPTAQTANPPRQAVPGSRMRTRAFIKVQDGCDNRCTFCIATIARGPARSRQPEAIIADIQAALDSGAQEAVLTGVHLGSWGKEKGFQATRKAIHCLYDLVEAILTRTSLPRLRLSSLEPWDLDESFFDLWETPRLCRHLHLPLQSGCDQTLRRMGRRTTQEDFARLIAAARKAVPEMAITTDIMVGFPGEDEAEFEDSLAFVEQMQFAGGHVFTYSARPGTVAARLPQQVPHALRKQRNAAMRQVIARSVQQYRQRFLGKMLCVLWEEAHPMTGNPPYKSAPCTAGERGAWQLSGLTDNYLRVTAQHHRNLRNQITSVLLKETNAEGLKGDITSLP